MLLMVVLMVIETFGKKLKYSKSNLQRRKIRNRILMSVFLILLYNFNTDKCYFENEILCNKIQT